MNAPTFRDAQQAFRDAIANGRLSDDPTAANYAGRYMYMHTQQQPPLMGRSAAQRDLFKHIDTREYLP